MTRDDETKAPGSSPIEPTAGDKTVPIAADRSARRSRGIGELESIQSDANGGEYLAHFRIQEMVGRGGMGTVYRAQDTLLDRQVAVKVLSDRLQRSPDFQSRFVAEAKILARMNHPNIPQIHFIGKADGRLFFAMEWIEGPTLEEVATAGRLAEVRALDIAIQAAEALRAAHEAGIVHRDVKPSNLMITPDGVVKVLDFGLARSRVDQEDSATAGFEGTPLYASPEQVLGAAVDARSDVYSLGLTLQRLITGRPPRAPSDLESALENRTVMPPSDLPDDVDCTSATRGVLARMLATDPADRFPDWGALLEALRVVYPRPLIAATVTSRLLAFLTDLLLAVLPLAVAFAAFWKTKGYFATTLFYDTSEGRIALGAGLFAWLAICSLVAGSRPGFTVGKLMQSIRVLRRDGKKLSRGRIFARTAIVWGPVCVAAGVQLDWPPATIGSLTGPAGGFANLCWFWSALWVLLIGTPLLGRNRLSLADWLSRTRVTGTGAKPAWHITTSTEQSRWRRLPADLLPGRRGATGIGAVLVWLVVAILVGVELDAATSGDRWRIYARHTMFERVRHGDPGWERLAERFLAGYLSSRQSTPDPSVLSFERHPFLPGIYAQPHPELVVENAVLGTRSSHYGKALQISGGYYDGGTRNQEVMESSDPIQGFRWNLARRVVYHGSFPHFLRALAHGKLTREGFEVLNPEDFVGLFRSGEDFILVAWPELRVGVPGTNVQRVLRLPHGSMLVSSDGATLSGAWGGWPRPELPNSILAAYAAEKDSLWGVAIDSVQRVVTLE